MSKKLSELVYAALDNAYDGGYTEIAWEKSEDVALNLQDYDSDVADSGAAVMDLIPHIEAWQKAKQGGAPSEDEGDE